MDILQQPIKGERPKAAWGAAVVDAINSRRLTGGGGVLVSEDVNGSTISRKKPWPQVRKLAPFPNGDRWAFGIDVGTDADEDLAATIYNIIVRTGQTTATKDELQIKLGSDTFTGTLYLLIDWADYPIDGEDTPFSLTLTAPTLTATQELVPLYGFTNGGWLVDWIHGCHCGQGWMPESWVQETP